jgi:hypothetical protein
MRTHDRNIEMIGISLLGGDRIVALCSMIIISAGLPAVTWAAVINRGQEGPPLSEIRPAPKSIYPDQQVITAQPSPSEGDPAYLGPVLLMKSAIVDLDAGTATLPLRRGRLESGESVWSIMTDTTDPNLADLHGVDYSPKLAYALTGKAGAKLGSTRTASSFSSPERLTSHLNEAPNFFPPKAAQPGSVGDASYSPLVQFANGKDALFNMPMVAFNVSEDDLVKICPRDGTVTLKLTLGYTFGKPIFYLSTEANDPVVATLEGATYTPALKDAPFALEDASPGEAAERIYVFVNGPTGIDNPFRQGLDSALSDKGTHGCESAR